MPMPSPHTKRGEATLNNHDPAHLKHRRIRVAQLAPLYEQVPPVLYGGNRTDGFIHHRRVGPSWTRRYSVCVWSSRMNARLVPCCNLALRLSGKPQLAASLQLAMLAEVYNKERGRFDIIHSHIDYWTFPFSNVTGAPTVSTMHGRMDIEDLHPIYQRF